MKKSGTKKINKKTLLAILIILLIILVAVIIVWFLNRNSLDTDSEIVTEAYSYIGNNDLEICSGLVAYADEVVEYDDLDNATRICQAYSLLDLDESSMVRINKSERNNTCSVSDNIVFATDNYEDEICTLTRVSGDLLNEQYRTMYGRDIESYDEFFYNDTTMCRYVDGFYYCGLAENYTTTFGGETHTYRTIKSASENGDELVIYDYFLKTINSDCYTSFVGTNTIDACSEDYSNLEDMTYGFLKEYGTLYKHTFKRSNDTYYWVKSEPAE